MGRYALILAAMLPLTPVYALAQQAAPAAAPTPKEPAKPSLTQSVETTNRAVGYTAWDDDFFYVAVQVNKPTLTGRNSQPFSNPLEDDAVYIAIQTDDDRTAARPTAHTVFVAASAAASGKRSNIGDFFFSSIRNSERIFFFEIHNGKVSSKALI